MRATRWFLPDMPDVVGMLRAQIAVTIEGMDAFEAWAGGDAASGEVVSDMEPRADAAKRELLETLRVAFVLPLEPEDLFTLSRGIDWILDWSRDVVEEADVMACAPDAGIAEMAARLSEAMRHIDTAVSLSRLRPGCGDRCRRRCDQGGAGARARLLPRHGRIAGG